MYSESEATAANVSCEPEKLGPGSLVVKRGITRQSAVTVVTVASALAVPRR
jgi:hypothetical protein